MNLGPEIEDYENIVNSRIKMDRITVAGLTGELEVECL